MTYRVVHPYRSSIMSLSLLEHIPSEIRYLIFAVYFSPIIKVHATNGAKSSDCRQLSFLSKDTHFALLRTCKQISVEASTVLFDQCQFHIADCNCFREGKIPLSARRGVRRIVSPPSAAGLALTRLTKLLDLRGLSEDEGRGYQLDRLAYLTIFHVQKPKNPEKGEEKRAYGGGPGTYM